MRLSGIALAAVCVCGPAAAGPAQQAPAATPAFSPAVSVADTVYVSGMLPTDDAGRIVAGDVRVQTARALDKLSALLKQNGSRLEQAASVTVYLRNAADFAAMNDVYGARWPEDPPARTTIIGNLVAPGALVEIGLVALKDGVERRVVRPAAWPRPPSPYSYAIQSGSTLYVSGLLSRNGRDNSVVPGDMRAQTHQVLENAREILAAAGMTLADVVSSRVFITDTAMFQDMNAAYAAGFPAAPPARATVRAGLTGPQYLVEIAMVAVKGPGRAALMTPNADLTPGRPNPVLSSAIRIDRRLFLSGMVGTHDATRGDVAAQTRETLARLGRTLQAAGFGWADVVDAVVYLPEMKDFPAMNAAWRAALTPPLPARATVETGLVVPDALVEISMTAVKRQD